MRNSITYITFPSRLIPVQSKFYILVAVFFYPSSVSVFRKRLRETARCPATSSLARPGSRTPTPVRTSSSPWRWRGRPWWVFSYLFAFGRCHVSLSGQAVRLQEVNVVPWWRGRLQGMHIREHRWHQDQRHHRPWKEDLQGRSCWTGPEHFFL